MSIRRRDENDSVISILSRMAFAVAIFALIAAGIGAVINHWLVGRMAVGGMVGIGVFYFTIGLLNLKSTSSVKDEKVNSNVSERTARMCNLYGEALSPARANDGASSSTTASLSFPKPSSKKNE